MLTALSRRIDAILLLLLLDGNLSCDRMRATRQPHLVAVTRSRRVRGLSIASFHSAPQWHPGREEPPAKASSAVCGGPKRSARIRNLSRITDRQCHFGASMRCVLASFAFNGGGHCRGVTLHQRQRCCRGGDGKRDERR